MPVLSGGRRRRGLLVGLASAGLLIGTVAVALPGTIAGASSKSAIVIGGLEGTAAEGGATFIDGMKVAADVINAKGGVDGHKVKIDVISTGGTPAGAVSAYESAASAGAIGAFLGASGGDAIRNQAPVTKVPVVIANGVQADYTPARPYVFANSQGSQFTTSSMEYAVKKFGIKSIAALSYTGDDFSEQVPGYIETGCKHLGCTVTANETAPYNASQSTLTPLLEAMKASNPDAYYIEGLNPSAFAAAQQLGMFDKPVISEQYLTVPPLAKACGTNCKTVAFAAEKCADSTLLKTSTLYKKLCSTYKAQFAKYISGPFANFSIYGDQAVQVMTTAATQLLKAGKKVTPAAINTKLSHIKGEQTLLGKVTDSPKDHLITGTFQSTFVMVTITGVANTAATFAIAAKTTPTAGAPTPLT